MKPREKILEDFNKMIEVIEITGEYPDDEHFNFFYQNISTRKQYAEFLQNIDKHLGRKIEPKTKMLLYKGISYIPALEELLQNQETYLGRKMDSSEILDTIRPAIQIQIIDAIPSKQNKEYQNTYMKFVKEFLTNPQKYGIEEIPIETKIDLLFPKKNDDSICMTPGFFSTILSNKEQYGLRNLTKEQIMQFIKRSFSDSMIVDALKNPEKYFGTQLNHKDIVQLITIPSFEISLLDGRPAPRSDSMLRRQIDILRNPKKYNIDELSSEEKINIVKSTNSGIIARYVLKNIKEIGIDITGDNIINLFRIAKINSQKAFDYLRNSMDNSDEIDKVQERIDKLKEKNNNIESTFIYSFLANDSYFEGENALNYEQLVRITNYPEVQEFIQKLNKSSVTQGLFVNLMKHSPNYIMSLQRLMDTEPTYESLIKKIENEKEDVNYDNSFYSQLLSIMSEKENYFDVANVEDVVNYYDRRAEICKKILDGEKVELPKNLEKKLYSKEDLYKFALLEYQFGISLEEAKRLVQTYGTDIESLANNEKYKCFRIIEQIKNIVESTEIDKVIKNAKQQGLFSDEPIKRFGTVSSLESKFIESYAELYNEQLLNPESPNINAERKEITFEGKKIEQITINQDFFMDIRVEGAYFSEGRKKGINWEEYYQKPSIENHGSCESIISNDMIATAKNINGVIVRLQWF
ncbi:MAG: hypothetical protein IKE01_04710 [Clostridia bacterium]|nr:hypothetical protein [Clostridia bacterium]